MGGRTWLSLAIGMIAVLALAGCSSSSPSSTSTSSGTVPVSLAIHDAPPSGVSVLSFQIHITGASLQPADSTAAAVSLVSKPEEVELEDLQTISAFLNTADVAAGTYNSLTVTFANPQMTILNDSGSTLTVGGKTCDNGQICEVQPTLNQASVTVSSSPFPLTLTSGSPVGLSLDFNLTSSLQGNLSVTPVVTVTSVTSGQSNQNDQQGSKVKLTGVVTAVDSSNQSFTIQVGLTGQTDTVLTNSKTEFDFGDQNCSANNFSCITVNSIVNVDAEMSSGQLMASDVEGVSLPKTQAVYGTVVSVNSAQSQFEIVLNDVEDSQDSQTLTLGLPVMVSVQSGATFQLNAGNLNISSTAGFGGFSSLMVGQEVAVSVSGVQVSGSAVTLTTNQVTLEMSQISGTVASVNASQDTFVLTNLPSLFTMNNITQILVTVGSNTEYENASGISSLSANQSVSVSGLLTANTSNAAEPNLLASAVRVRQD
jgi:hypothetical protein